jgi:(p)ppGpp synthase/HD superfamily hydrolase
MTASPAQPLSARFSEALTYAATLHRQQARKGSGTPYLAHLMAVSSLVLEDGGTEDEAIGGLLHDAAEDQGREILTYLREVFGDVVDDIVKECSDALPAAGEEKPLWLERKTAYVMHLRDAGLSTVRVSAADKLHNVRSTLADLRTTGGWPPSNTCVHRNLWYYAALEQAFRERLPDSRTLAELSLAVDDLYRLTPGAGSRKAVGHEPDGCDCTDTKGSNR